MATATIIQAMTVIPYKSSGGNSKGDIVQTGNRIGVVMAAIAAGAIGSLAIEYIADFPNTLGTTISDGVNYTWDGTTVQTTLTTGVPLGVATQAQASADTTARVYVGGSGNSLQVANVAAGTTAYQQTVQMPFQHADIASAAGYVLSLPYAFTINAAQVRVNKPVTTGSKLATLTISTSGGTVTGGVMSLTSANQTPAGSATATATAISGTNATVVAGGTIIVTATSVTAFTEGDGWLEITVTNNDLKNVVNGLLTNLKASGIQASS